MKVYIIHYDKLIHRRLKLEEQLKKYNLTDVEWITEYPKEHPIINKLRFLTDTKIPNGYISNSLKHYEAFRRMCEYNINEAIILEDDVIFSTYWDISKIPREFPYVKLGKGTLDMGIELGNSPRLIGNNGGSEAYYVKRMFARDFIENIDVGWTIDIEQHAYMIHNSIPLLCVPMCSQEYSTSVEGNKDYGMTWIQYIQEYYPKSKKISFTSLVQSNDVD
jgi:GR25 family glycosyltransferase involved in LPS biosynthesis